MDKSTGFLGIDISKDVFDVINMRDQHFQFQNSIKGFRDFRKTIGPDSICVMEATGYYHLKLAYFLLEKNINVSIVNPLFLVVINCSGSSSLEITRISFS